MQMEDPMRIEDQPVFESLFFIASDDLDCSEILYQEQYYPQSVFYLQQAVEKAVKSMALLFEAIPEKDLHRKVGHKPLEVFRRPINTLSENIIALSSNPDESPEFKTIIQLSEIDLGEFTTNIKKWQHYFNAYIQNIANYKLTAEEFAGCLNTIENIDNAIYEAEKKIREDGINDEQFTAMKGELKTRLESTLILLKISDEEKEEMRNELNSFFTAFLPNVELFKFTISILIKILRIGVNLFCLSIITTSHATKSRYPESDTNPLTLYTSELPLIERMHELHEITRHTLDEMDRLFDLMFNPPEDLADLPEPEQLPEEDQGGDGTR